MAYASRSGRARTSISNPEAFAVCNRCGIWYNRVNLRNQMAWRGAALLPTWVFVCNRCYDVPQENDRVIVLPADPVPIQLPFPEDFEAANSTVMALHLSTRPQTLMTEVDRVTDMVTTDDVYMGQMEPPPTPLAVDPQTGLVQPNTTAMQTVDGVVMGPTPVGRPPGYYALDATPTAANDVVNLMAEAGGDMMAQTDGTYMATEEKGGTAPPGDLEIDGGEPVPVISMMANGTPLVTCTCNKPHNLALNAQINVRGTLQPLADGTFSVIPITATVFTYGTYSPVPSGSILGAETRIVTTQMGLPRSFTETPQTGLPQSPPTKTSQ